MRLPHSPSRPSSRPWWASGPDKQGRLVGQVGRIFTRLLVGTLVLAPLAWSTMVNPGLAVTTVNGGGVRQPPSLPALLNACTGITVWPEAPAEEIGWIEAGSDGTDFFAWRVSPPTSGNFARQPWPGAQLVRVDDAHRPTPAEAMALSYRGWTVLWYLPTMDADVLAEFLPVAEMMTQRYPQLLIAPWPIEPKGTWPQGRSFIFTAWNTTLSCGQFSTDLLEEFQSKRSGAPGERLSLVSDGPPAEVNSYMALSLLTR
jgi:hypothetical protein